MLRQLVLVFIFLFHFADLKVPQALPDQLCEGADGVSLPCQIFDKVRKQMFLQKQRFEHRLVKLAKKQQSSTLKVVTLVNKHLKNVSKEMEKEMDAMLDGTNSKIGKLEEQLNRRIDESKGGLLNETTSKLNSDLKKLKTGFKKQMEDNMGVCEKNMKNLADTVDKNFDSVNESLEERFTEVEDNLKKVFSKVDKKFDDLSDNNQKIQTHINKVTKVSNGFNDNFKKISADMKDFSKNVTKGRNHDMKFVQDLVKNATSDLRREIMSEVKAMMKHAKESVEKSINSMAAKLENTTGSQLDLVKSQLEKKITDKVEKKYESLKSNIDEEIEKFKTDKEDFEKKLKKVKKGWPKGAYCITKRGPTIPCPKGFPFEMGDKCCKNI